MIDLVMKLEMEYAINPDLFSFQRNTTSNKTPNHLITIQNIVPITHPKLIAWVQERKIDLDLANRHCREVHYQNKEKDYFSIGFRNDKGGYELSSPSNFKGCIAPKDITTIQNNRDACLVFEGF
jgi:hypothetical protein